MWKSPKSKGGTDGLIPMRHAILLLKVAKIRGVDIGPESFFPPIDESEAAQ